MTDKEQNGSAPTVSQNQNIQAVLKFLRDNGTLVALVILALFFTFADEAFFTPRNLTNLARQTTIVGIIAVGMTMVILINGIDLSVGSIVGLAAITVTLLMQRNDCDSPQKALLQPAKTEGLLAQQKI